MGTVFTDLAEGLEAGLAAGLLAALGTGGLTFLAGDDLVATVFLATLALAGAALPGAALPGAALPLGVADGLALPVLVVLAVNSCLLKETPCAGRNAMKWVGV